MFSGVSFIIHNLPPFLKVPKSSVLQREKAAIRLINSEATALTIKQQYSWTKVSSKTLKTKMLPFCFLSPFLFPKTVQIYSCVCVRNEAGESSLCGRGGAAGPRPPDSPLQ